MTLQTMPFIFGALLLAVGILGGGFEVKEIKISNASTSVRMLASLVGLVFMVVGLDYGHPTALTGAVPAVATATMSEREHAKDRFGGDYTGFDVNASSLRSPWTASERMFTRGGSGRQSRTRPQRL